MAKNCFNCLYFTAYYTKAYCCFLRTKCGHCSKHDRLTEKHDGCEEWKSHYYRKKLKAGFVISGLNEAITSINAIKLILDENSEELRWKD